jgi:hypothetical protein
LLQWQLVSKSQGRSELAVFDAVNMLKISFNSRFNSRSKVYWFFISLMMAPLSLLIIFSETLRTTAFLNQHPPHNANKLRQKTQPDKKQKNIFELLI